jgi:5-methylcytosine-specific restriction endonuclease McrA
MAVGSSRGTAWEKVRAQVLQRDQGICVYCGGEATEADHVVPKSMGGTDTLDNLVASCKKDNASKQDKLWERTYYFNKAWLEGIPTGKAKKNLL